MMPFRQERSSIVAFLGFHLIKAFRVALERLKFAQF